MGAIFGREGGSVGVPRRKASWFCKWQVAAIATLLPMCVQAQQGVTVCVQRDAVVYGRTLIVATELTERVFAAIGVRINWCHDKPGGNAISIEFSEDTPMDYHPRAVAVALPYEGVRIRVFYDRIARRNRAGLIPTVLGYVLAHEIAHILEGCDRHSETGVMKAEWNAGDVHSMESGPLSFAAEDVILIRAGLAARARVSKAELQTIAATIAGPAN